MLSAACVDKLQKHWDFFVSGTERKNFIESRIQDSDDFDDDLYKQPKAVKNEELQQALLIGQITKKPLIICIFTAVIPT